MTKEVIKRTLPKRRKRNNPFMGEAPPAVVIQPLLDEKEESKENKEMDEKEEKKLTIPTKIINLNLKIEPELKNAFRVLSHKEGVSMTNYFRLLIISAVEARVKANDLQLSAGVKAFLAGAKKKAEAKVTTL